MSKGQDDDALRLAREALRDMDREHKAEENRDQFEKEGEEIHTSYADKMRETVKAARRINKAVDIAKRTFEKIKEYAGPVGRIIGGIYGGSKAAFLHAAYLKNKDGTFKLDENGDKIFSGKKLGRTFAVATCIGLTAYVGGSYGYYKGTQFEELVYTTGKQEIVSGELYHVTGCTSLPCSTDTDNGKYYQITKSWFAPRVIYPEETVYANIPQEISACHFKGYGVYSKALKPVFRWAEWYQNVESASCRPLTEAEVQQAITQGGAPEAPVIKPHVIETAPGLN